MQIDSVKMHEAINQVALERCTSVSECMMKIRRKLNDIEADAACQRALYRCSNAIDAFKVM